MSARTERFDVDGSVEVEVALSSGDVLVTGGKDGMVEVRVDGGDADRFTIEQRGRRVVVNEPRGRGTRWRSHDLVITVPPATSLRARLASADLDADTDLADVEVEAASSGIRLADIAGSVRTKTASGDLRTGSIGGSLTARTASGEVVAGPVTGSVRVVTVSGDIRIGGTPASVDVRSTSGTVAIEDFGGDRLSSVTVSGDVTVQLPQGRSVDVDLQTLSGRIRDQAPVGAAVSGPPDGEVTIRTVSGDITISARR